MDVHLGGAMVFIEPQGPGHLGQRWQEAAIDGGQSTQGLGLFADDDGSGLVGQFGDQWVEGFGVKDVTGFAQRPEGNALAAEQALNFVELAGLLDATQAGEDGVEEVKQQEGGVLVEEEFAVAGAVTLGSLVTEAIKERAENLEIFQAAQFGIAYHGPRFVCHSESVAPRRDANGATAPDQAKEASELVSKVCYKR